jgi:hypothetical protein
MIWILIIIAAFVLLSSGKSETQVETPTSTTVTNSNVYKIAKETSSSVRPVQQSIQRIPPPGYTGPVNGPFVWAGVGNPPNGEYTTLGMYV